MSTMRYRLEDNTRYSRYEDGELVLYKAGTEKDTVNLTPEEAAKFAPGRITPLSSTSEVKKVIEASISPAEVEALRSADHRSTVTTAADKRLVDLSKK